MTQNAKMIYILCSQDFVDLGAKPYTATEWHSIACKLRYFGKQPADIIAFDNEDIQQFKGTPLYDSKRLATLLAREAQLLSKAELYRQYDINIVTIEDEYYPTALKQKIPALCPPILYCLGYAKLLNNVAIGMVGSRKIEDEDVNFLAGIAKTATKKGYTIVSGGALGSDRIAETTSLANGGCVVSYIVGNLLQHYNYKRHKFHIINGNLVLVTAVPPFAEFSSTSALSRNKYIYASSIATVVSKADFRRGGTWSGASYALTHNLCPILTNEQQECDGIEALRNLGAIKIAPDWAVNFEVIEQYEQCDILNYTDN